MAKSIKATCKESGSSRRRKQKQGSEEKSWKKGVEESKQVGPSWAVMKSILSCKHLQVEPKQQEKQLQPKQKSKKQEDSLKKSKKMRCSGSLCNNTKVITERTAADHHQSSSPDQLLFYKRKVSASSSFHSSSSSSLAMSMSMSMVGSDQNVSSRSFGSTTITSSSSSSSSSSLLNANANSQNAPPPVSVSVSVSVKGGGSFKGMPFRKLSGCYECRSVVDPVLGLTRDPSLRATISCCPQCGEIFMKPDLLHLHLATKHAVSELGPEDTSRNIVEIIFQSSWLKKEIPVCKIDRILKVHNTNRTVSRFEEYRELIKGKATRLPKKHPRCIADGNELLRFHCTTLMCSLGLNGSSNLCNSSPSCSVCGIIRDGFKSHQGTTGILTTATSGRAHDRAEVVGPAKDHHPQPQPQPGGHEPRKAMLVCRVIAGRVNKPAADGEGVLEEYDSVAAGHGVVYSDLDELYVYNPRAILPCFVVIYRGF